MLPDPSDPRVPSAAQLDRARKAEVALTAHLRDLQRQHIAAGEAARWLQACKEFDSERSFRVEDSNDVALEKYGRTPDVIPFDFNLEFCTEWVASCWVGSAPHVVTGLGVETLMNLEPPAGFREVVKLAFATIRAVYVDLLRSDLQDAAKATAAKGLAQLRDRLAGERKIVCAFFEVAENAARSRQASLADQRDKERQRLRTAPSRPRWDTPGQLRASIASLGTLPPESSVPVAEIERLTGIGKRRISKWKMKGTVLVATAPDSIERIVVGSLVGRLKERLDRLEGRRNTTAPRKRRNGARAPNASLARHLGTTAT